MLGRHLVLMLLAGCASEPAPVAEEPRAPEPAPAPAAAPEPEPEASATPAPEPEKPKEEAVAYPPAKIEPPHERSAQPGDGEWTRLGDAKAGDRAAEGEALIHRTVLHPHPVSKWITVTVAAIDLQRAALHLVAGTDEPIDKDAPAALRTGLVPSEHQDDLLVVTNGGWKTAHGRWGMMVAGHVFVPARPEGCTIAIAKDHTARIQPWPEIESRASELAAWRQTPPCLLANGELHPQLAAGQERPWGGMDPKLKTRRRSALGVDKTGKILFYGFGDEASAKLLAEGMRLAGAVEAAELDINYSWTRFLLVGKPKPDAPLQVTSTLIPKMVHDKTGYVSKAAPRDFFYIRRR